MLLDVPNPWASPLGEQVYFCENLLHYRNRHLFVVRPDDGSMLQVVDPPEGQLFYGAPLQWGDRLLVRTSDSTLPYEKGTTVLQGVGTNAIA